MLRKINIRSIQCDKQTITQAVMEKVQALKGIETSPKCYGSPIVEV